MSCSLYVRGLPAEITLEELAIYFQSSTKSGGGDVDLDACKLYGNSAVMVFEKPECKYVVIFQETLSNIALRKIVMNQSNAILVKSQTDKQLTICV